MSDRPPSRRALDKATRQAPNSTSAPPRRRNPRNPRECTDCNAAFPSRSALVWHRIQIHLRVSNAAGEISSRSSPLRGANANSDATGGDGDTGVGEDRGGAVSGSGGSATGGGGGDTPVGDGGRQAFGDRSVAATGEAGDAAVRDGAGVVGGLGGNSACGAAGCTGVNAAGIAPCDGRCAASGAAGCAGANATGGHGGDANGTVEGGAAKTAFDPANDLSEEVKQELLALMEATREEVDEEEVPGRKRRRLAAGATAERRFTYATTSTAVRALYEEYGDWERAEAAVNRRKGFRTGRFNSFRLRAVQRFALKSGGAGVSLQWLQELFDLLDTWDGTKPGMPIDDLHEQPIRKAFNSCNAFKDAVRDDVDDAVLEAGWMKCTLVIDGERFTALFRPVLRVVLDMLRAGKKVQLWSGENGPALPTDKRESPLDGDAFRLNEAAVMADKKDPACFVLGLHVYSDASQLSWSGGTFVCSVWRATV